MRAQLHAGDTLRIRYAGAKPSSTQGRAWRTVRIIVGPHEDYDYTHGPVVTVKDLTDPDGECTKTLYVAVWYASAYAFGETAPGVTPKIQVDLVDDATLSTLDTFTVDDLPQARNPSRGARLAASGLVSTSGLLSGLEVYASNAWIESPLSVSGLSGADGWLVIEATGAQVLAVGWVEVVNAEVG